MSDSVDWAGVEIEYRAGSLSEAEIARRFNVPRSTLSKFALRHGWNRNLSEDVRKELRQQLLRDEMKEVAERTSDKEVVAQAAKRAADVVNLHRKDIKKLQSLSQTLMDRLKRTLEARDEAELESIGICIGAKESPAGMLESLVRSMARLIPLERQAYNIDEPKQADDINLGQLPRNILVAISNQIREKQESQTTINTTAGEV